MKLGEEHPDLDDIDRQILALMQENCRLPLAKIGEKVRLSAPSVMERVKKLEDGGIITAYRAVVNARLLGKDITAFIGVSTGHPHAIGTFEREIESLDDVLECHHVTGMHTLILKAKTRNTSSLEELISRIRSIEGWCGRRRWWCFPPTPSVSRYRWWRRRRSPSAGDGPRTRPCI